MKMKIKRKDKRGKNRKMNIDGKSILQPIDPKIQCPKKSNALTQKRLIIYLFIVINIIKLNTTPSLHQEFLYSLNSHSDSILQKKQRNRNQLWRETVKAFAGTAWPAG